jgi:glycosyltransferase involved in cell wall biosynthesis
MTNTISLHLIAKDEAHNLPILLDSVKRCFDKIYLTDTGSKDDTVKIAKEYGCEVSHFEWIGDFAAARNFCFEQGTEDFQMWLDCDDSLNNPEAFKLWKQEVMPLADYHLAVYHYASDSNGVPVCSFARERVVRRSMKFRWHYFLHEGILPVSTVCPVRQDMAHTWSVKHRRSAEDLAADRARNISIFKGRERHLDARMTWYYGKELWEAGLPEPAIEKLNKALEMPLELHDKVLCYQYLMFAYISQADMNIDFFNKYKDKAYHDHAIKYFEDAINTAHKGLLLDPNRAEYLVNVADCYLKMSQFQKAIPYLSAAKSCKPSQVSGQVGALFHAGELYSYYPRLQLTKSLLHSGDVAGAEKEAIELASLHPTDEAKQLLKELKQHNSQSVISTETKPIDDIVISCPPGAGFFEWDGLKYRSEFCGGSETAAIELAENLAKITGKRVLIFNDRKETLTVNGVTYIPVGQLVGYFKEFKPYLHIAWRHSTKLTNAYTILWCHDLVTPGAENIGNYDILAALTPFHKRYIMARQGIPDEKIWVTRNGLDPGKFKTKEIKRDPFKFVFSSSPDRGLDRAMLVLDRVRAKFPLVTLSVHYGIEHLGKYGLEALQQKLSSMMNERKDWVTYVGKTNQTDLIESFKSSAYCVQPSDFIESSMISAMERLACGVYQIIRKVGAVQDTLKWADENGMAKLVDRDCLNDADLDAYASEVIKAIEDEAYKRVNFDPETVSWKGVASDWALFVEKVGRK